MRLIFCCLFFPFFCLSQQTINADTFFSMGLSDLDSLEKTTQRNVNFPWIEEYQIRTETDEFDFDRQEYTVRVAPSTSKIRKAQKALYDEMRNAPDVDGQEIYCDKVLTLHLDWLKIFILNENKTVLDQLAVVLKDKQTVYERMVGSLDFNPERLLKLQIEKSDLELDLNEIITERNYFLNKYNIQDKKLDFSNFTNIETISKYLANANLIPQNDSEPIDLETEHEKQLLIKEIELEKSENKKFLDFVQVKYRGPHDDLFRERVSVGIGLAISNSGNTKLKIQELQIKQDELTQKSIRDVQERQETIKVLKNRLESDIKVFLHFQKTMKDERIHLKKLSNKISQKEGTSPLFLLDMEERHLSMKIKSLDKKEDLINDYLRFLYQSNKMCQTDFVNHLKI